MEIKDLSAAAVEWGTAQAANDAANASAAATADAVAAMPSGDVALVDTTPAAVSPTPVAEPTPTFETFEGRLGDETIALRSDTMIPIIVDGQTQFVALSEVRQNGMRQADYTRKTQQLAEQRKQVEQSERELRIASAAYAKQQEMQKAEQEKALRVNSDPDEYEKFLRHSERMQSDPEYRDMWQKAKNAEMREIMETATAEVDQELMQQAIVDDIANTAEQLAQMPEFAGIPARDAVAVYTTRLNAGQAELTEGALVRVFKDLAGQRTSILTPVQKEMAELKAQLAALTAQQEADKANAGTRARIPASQTNAVVPNRQPNRSAPVANTGTEGAPRRRTMSLDTAAAAWAAQ